MTERRIRVYRDGDRAVLADIVDERDYSGIVRVTRLTAQDAIAIGEALAAIGHEIDASRNT